MTTQMNNVEFSRGYLQPPFFSGKEDDAANYGDMGSTTRPRADPRLR